MDEETLKTMPDYVQKLPKKVRNFVFDGVWEERAGEIAAKYSLTESQTDIFINKVLFILIGMENPDNFLGSLMSELDISELLAKQIIEDVEKRVFQYAMESISKQDEAVKPGEPEKIVQNPVTTPAQSVPRTETEVEMPPEILPMVESDEERKKVMAEIPANLPGVPVSPKVDTAKAPATPDVANKTQEGTFVGAEFVQKPIAVPRFNAVSTPEPTQDVTKTVSPAPGGNSAAQNPAPTPAAPADKKPAVEYPPRYTVDPYREPLE